MKHPLAFYLPKSESAEEAIWWRDLFQALARAKGWKPAGHFKLGGWGMLVNVLALAFGVVMIVNLVWPRTPDAPWYLNAINLLSVLFIFVLGLLQLGNVNRQTKGG